MAPGPCLVTGLAGFGLSKYKVVSIIVTFDRKRSARFVADAPFEVPLIQFRVGFGAGMFFLPYLAPPEAGQRQRRTHLCTH